MSILFKKNMTMNQIIDSIDLCLGNKSKYYFRQHYKIKHLFFITDNLSQKQKSTLKNL